ncbi:hypothetical protein [Micromonospora arborensis]|uniref:hypothetical protein n=1 Tax=Micromonospora arborensis TaxID=2116518 RepID=UPI00142DB5AE|nr:hypothetical protein [Micromonospora arborensis]
MVAPGTGSTWADRAVRASLGRRTTSPAGRIRHGGSVRAGRGHRTAAPAGGVRAGRPGRPATGATLAGRRRMGQGLFPGGSRRVRSGGTTTGRCVRARVGRRAGGPAVSGALHSRVGHAEATRRVVSEFPDAPGRRRAAASAVDHRQAGVGVRQATGLAQPVGRPLRAVRPGFTAGRRASLRVIGDSPAATGAVGRADGGRGAAVTAGGLGHRQRVARTGNGGLVGLGGTAAAGGCRTGAFGATAAGGLRCPRVDRAWTTPRGTRVTVDGGVGPQAVRDRRHGARRRPVEAGRAGGG